MTSSTTAAPGVQGERGQLARRDVPAQRLDEGVEAEVLAVAGHDPPRLEVDDHLAALPLDRAADDQVDAGAQHDRALERELRRGLGHRVPPAVEGREALEELGDPLDRLPAQVGLAARTEPGDVVAELARLVGEPGERLVDEVGRGRFAAPVEQQLDRLVRHLAAGASRRPREGVGGEVVGLAVEHAGDRVLGDEQLGVTEPGAELGERGIGVVTELGDDLGIEDERRIGAPQGVEGALLDRREPDAPHAGASAPGVGSVIGRTVPAGGS